MGPVDATERAAIDVCDACGFRWQEYDDETAVNALRLGGAFYRGILDGVDLELANTRPDASTWSILEYVDHVRQAYWIWRFSLDVTVDGLDVDLHRPAGGGPDPEPARFDSVEGTVEAMEAEGSLLWERFRSLTPEQWPATAVVRQGVIDASWIVRHQLHEVLHHGHDLGRLRHQLGDGVPHQTGTIHQLNVSGGGVPKQPVESAEVGFRGLAGDHQNDRVHHGRPFQAVCLYGLDVIEALQAEGHPIQPGSVGENVTVAGLDWATLRPGAQVAIGDDLLLELSSYAIPCAKNAPWFTGGDFRRMAQDRHPGWSRLYGTVLRPGTVRTGDPVVVEPEG
jgi:MOSC domain-containing protein YiiM